jgi:hypothetical protein
MLEIFQWWYELVVMNIGLDNVENLSIGLDNVEDLSASDNTEVSELE